MGFEMGSIVMDYCSQIEVVVISKVANDQSLSFNSFIRGLGWRRAKESYEGMKLS